MGVARATSRHEMDRGTALHSHAAIPVPHDLERDVRQS